MPSEGPLLAPGEDFARVGRFIAQHSTALLRRSGASPETLQEIGSLVGKLTAPWRTKQLDDPASPLHPSGDCRLWCDEDGTFELMIKVFNLGEKMTPALAYDTWSVVTPIKGTVRLHWLDGDRLRHLRLAPGECRGFDVGSAVAIEVLGHSQVALLRLFGITPLLLPPPAEVSLHSKPGQPL